MIKKSYILPLVVLLIICGFLFNVFKAGNKHVTVVTNNVQLHSENTKLKVENTGLKEENSTLKVENKTLAIKLDNITAAPTNTLPKAIIQMEIDVREKIGWITPEMAYDLLKEKLNRTPTSKELYVSFAKLVDRSMLYYSGTPDPYIKGEKITQDKLDSVIIRLRK